MRKIISILVIIMMLSSICLMAIPTSAASNSLTLPVTSWSKPWQSAPGEWTAISSYEDLKTKFKSGSSETQLAKYYLTSDITIGSEAMFKGVAHKSYENVNFIFDGNGYSFIFKNDSSTVSRSVFNAMNNATIRNLKLTGEFKAGDHKGNDCSPLGSEVWTYSEKITLENIASDVNITISNTSGDKAVGGVIQHVKSGSVIKNVTYSGTITLPKAKNVIIGAVGGIVGYIPSGCTVSIENCKNTGNIIIDEGALLDGKAQLGVGGIVGSAGASSSLTFTNCLNSGTLTATGKVSNDGKTNTNSASMGGLIGASEGALNFIGCTNNGVLKSVSVKGAMGGFVGSAATGKVSFTDCNNNGPLNHLDVDAGTKRGLGGFAGMIANDLTNTFVRCTNTKNGVITHSTISSSVNGAAGFVGIAEAESPKVANLKITFTDCQNLGNVVNKDKLESGGNATNPSTARGGFIGLGKSTNRFEFTNCVNKGDIVKGANDTGSNAAYQAAGGFVGLERYLGFGGQGGTSGTTKFVNCLNAGNVYDVNSAGGFVGKNFEIKKGNNDNDNSYDYNVIFENCVNTGTIQSKLAGGLFGAITETQYGGANVDVSMEKCVNSGSIKGNKSGEGVLGGLMGAAYYGTLTVNNCINAGDIAKATYAAGVAAHVTNLQTTISNTYVIGAIDNESKTINPVCNGKSAYSKNLFDKEIIDDWFDEADNVSLAEVEAAIEKIDIMAGYGFDRLDEKIDEVKALEAKKNTFKAELWQAVETALDEAERVSALEILTYKNGGGVTILKQNTVNKAYYDLCTARDALGDNEEYNKLKATVDAAEALKADDYTEGSWLALQSAMATAKSAMASGNDSIMIQANELLSDAIKGLVKAEKKPADNDGENDGDGQTPESDDADQTTKPDSTDKKTDDKKAEDTEESGCGSVIGGATVAVAAVVMALGAGVSLKKKER